MKDDVITRIFYHHCLHLLLQSMSVHLSVALEMCIVYAAFWIRNGSHIATRFVVVLVGAVL